MLAQRFDRTPIPKTRVTGAGGLRIPASIARTGPQEYSDGVETWYEYRDPEEVFSPQSLATISDVPVTINHEGGMISPASWKKYAHGHAGGRARVQDGWVLADLVVSSDEAIQQVHSGDLVEISAGYGCQLVPFNQVVGGKLCKFRQTSIRYNHISLLPPGTARAGSDARLRLDHARAGTHSIAISKPDRGPQQMKTFKIDAKNARAVVGEAQYDLSTQQGRLDAVKALNTTITAPRLDQMDPAAMAIKFKDLQALAMGLVEGLELLSAELSAEASVEEMPLEEVEQMVGSETMDRLVALRADVVARAQAFSVSTENKTTTEIMRDVLDARGVVVQGMDDAQVRDFYARSPKATFDARDREIVGSGPADKPGSSLDKALAASKEKRKDAWRSKKRKSA